MSRVGTLAAKEIVPRRISPEIPDDARRHWFDGDAASTHMFNALSVGFPRGEKLFVDSVRAYRDRIRDPELAEAVRRFVAQETHHSRAHEAFNAWLTRCGLPVAEVEALVVRDMAWSEANLPPEVLLAVTAALEHFTALLARALVEAPGFLDAIDEPIRTLWLWHALEETEHKSVAIDVYRHVGGRESVRLAAMAVISVLFVRDAFAQQAMFMKADGRGRDVRSYARFARRFFGEGGHLSGLLGPYLAYYRRDFHPWQDDDGSTMRKARAMLEKALAGEGREPAGLAA